MELRDEVITLFAGGHATTAMALTWTWYLLARHPDCEAALHRELDTVLKGRAADISDLPNLPYTANLVAEALRLYPPVWMLGRMAKEDLELGGYRIPAGSICLLSPYLMQHGERYFEEPDRFHPERWTAGLREHLPKFAYLPFGAGARVCIGERFALVEINLVLATLAAKWRFQLVEADAVEVRPRVMLRPARDIRMRLIPR